MDISQLRDGMVKWIVDVTLMYIYIYICIYIYIYTCFFDVTIVYSYEADLGRWGNGQMVSQMVV